MHTDLGCLTRGTSRTTRTGRESGELHMISET